MLIEYPSGYQTSDLSTMTNENPGSNNRAQPRSYPDGFNRGIQYSQVSIQINLILLLLHKILSSLSRQRATCTCQWGSMRISHIMVLSITYNITVQKIWVPNIRTYSRPISRVQTYFHSSTKYRYIQEICTKTDLNSWK